jgi:hypothetical protein
VDVARIRTATLTLRVEADGPEDSKNKAVEKARDTDFAGCGTDYDFAVNAIMEVPS